jgi:hypothetical protein
MSPEPLPPPPLDVLLAGNGLDSATGSVDSINRQSWGKFWRDRWESLYGYYLRDPRLERRFVAFVAFLVTFIVVRSMTLLIRAEIGPFHNVQVGETHVHHLVPGILALLVVGYLWLLGLGTESAGTGGSSAATSALYGLAAALTLDEFALWLNLKDVYWESAGRISFDAVAIFAALLGAAFFGGAFLRAVGGDLSWLLHRALGRDRPSAV